MKRKLLIYLLFLILGLALGRTIFGATIFDEDFESCDIGSLNGNAGCTGWVGDTIYKATTTQAYQGTQTGAWAPSNDKTIYKDGTAQTTGNIIFYVYPKQTNARGVFKLQDVATYSYGIWFRDTGQISVYRSGGFTDQQAYSANTQYKIETDWDCAVDTFRIRIDDGAWSSAYAMNAGCSSIGRFFIDTDNPSGSFYVDYIGTFETPPAAPAGELDYNLILAIIMLGILLIVLIDFLRRLALGI